MSSLRDKCIARRHGVSASKPDEKNDAPALKSNFFANINQYVGLAIIEAVERAPIYRDDIPHR